MFHSTFELLGHDNPLANYPAPVVPVGVLDNHIIAIYTGNNQPNIVELEQDCEFVRHTSLITETLRPFDYQSHRLFAFKKDHIVHYLADYEANFFSALLEDQSFAKDNPFLRFTFAKPTKKLDLITQELWHCLINLKTAHPDFAGVWYTKEMQKLAVELNYRNEPLFPDNWKDFLQNFNKVIDNQNSTKYFQHSEQAQSTKQIENIHYKNAINLVNKVLIESYRNEFEKHYLLEQAYEQLNIALRDESNDALSKTLIDYEMMHLDYLSEDYEAVENKYNLVYDSCILNGLYDKLAMIEGYLMKASWENRYQKRSHSEPAYAGALAANLFGT